MTDKTASSSRRKHTVETGQMHTNGCKLCLKQILPVVFLTILMKLDPLTILSFIVHIVRMIFAFY